MPQVQSRELIQQPGMPQSRHGSTPDPTSAILGLAASPTIITFAPWPKKWYVSQTPAQSAATAGMPKKDSNTSLYHRDPSAPSTDRILHYMLSLLHFFIFQVTFGNCDCCFQHRTVFYDQSDLPPFPVISLLSPQYHASSLPFFYMQVFSRLVECGQLA